MTGVHQAIAGGNSLPPSSSAYLSAVSFNGNQTSYVTSSRSLGTAQPLRKIVAAVSSSRLTGASAPSSVALDTLGINMTLLAETDNGQINTSIWIASVPTGTSDTFTITFPSQQDGMAIAFWELTMYSSTPHQTISDGGTSPANAGSITCPANCLALAVYGVYATVTTTWTNLTEDVDGQYDSGSAAYARQAFATAQSGLSVVATASSAGQTDALTVVVLPRGK